MEDVFVVVVVTAVLVSSEIGIIVALLFVVRAVVNVDLLFVSVVSVATALSSASFIASNPSIRFDCSNCFRNFNVDNIIRSFFIYCSRLSNRFFCPLDNPICVGAVVVVVAVVV